MTVFIIHEENHGTIGVATSIKEAVKWLIESEWICANEDYFDGKYNKEKGKWEYTSPMKRYGENWKEIFPERPTDEIENFLDGVFYFEEYTLYGAE